MRSTYMKDVPISRNPKDIKIQYKIITVLNVGSFIAVKYNYFSTQSHNTFVHLSVLSLV